MCLISRSRWTDVAAGSRRKALLVTATPSSPPPTPSPPPQACQRPDEPSHTSGVSLTAYLQNIKKSKMCCCMWILLFVFFLSDIRGKMLHLWLHQVIFLLESVYCISISPFSILMNWVFETVQMKSHLHMWRFGSRDGKWFFSFMLQVHFPQRSAYCLSADMCKNKDCSCLPDWRASEFISALSKVSMKRCPLGRYANLKLQDNKGDKSKRRRTQTTRDSCQQTVLCIILTYFACKLV